MAHGHDQRVHRHRPRSRIGPAKAGLPAPSAPVPLHAIAGAGPATACRISRASARADRAVGEQAGQLQADRLHIRFQLRFAVRRGCLLRLGLPQAIEQGHQHRLQLGRSRLAAENLRQSNQRDGALARRLQRTRDTARRPRPPALPVPAPPPATRSAGAAVRDRPARSGALVDAATSSSVRPNASSTSTSTSTGAPAGRLCPQGPGQMPVPRRHLPIQPGPLRQSQVSLGRHRLRRNRRRLRRQQALRTPARSPPDLPSRQAVCARSDRLPSSGFGLRAPGSGASAIRSGA